MWSIAGLRPATPSQKHGLCWLSTWSGQTWSWPNLVWPNLVLAKLGLATLGNHSGQTWIWPNLVSPAPTRLAYTCSASEPQTAQHQGKCRNIPHPSFALLKVNAQNLAQTPPQTSVMHGSLKLLWSRNWPGPPRTRRSQTEATWLCSCHPRKRTISQLGSNNFWNECCPTANKSGMGITLLTALALRDDVDGSRCILPYSNVSRRTKMNFRLPPSATLRTSHQRMWLVLAEGVLVRWGGGLHGVHPIVGPSSWPQVCESRHQRRHHELRHARRWTSTPTWKNRWVAWTSNNGRRCSVYWCAGTSSSTFVPNIATRPIVSPLDSHLWARCGVTVNSGLRMQPQSRCTLAPGGSHPADVWTGKQTWKSSTLSWSIDGRRSNAPHSTTSSSPIDSVPPQ